MHADLYVQVHSNVKIPSILHKNFSLNFISCKSNLVLTKLFYIVKS